MAALPTRCGRDGRGNTKKTLHQFKPLVDAWAGGCDPLGVEMPLRRNRFGPSQHQGPKLTMHHPLCGKKWLVFVVYRNHDGACIQANAPPSPPPRPNDENQIRQQLKLPTHQSSWPLHPNSPLNKPPIKKHKDSVVRRCRTRYTIPLPDI